MLRFVFPLALLPTVAAAQWVPRPAMFNYDAVFDVCTADPSAPDLGAACYDTLAAAYALKRATAVATAQCGDDDLATCAAPFEDQGLPAIAMRIAVDVGCIMSGLPDTDGQLPADHCAVIASDIMIDEGVVPLSTGISCGLECGDLARINANLWVARVNDSAPDDPVVADLLVRNFNDCNAPIGGADLSGPDLDALRCLADRAALLWADIALQNEQDN